MVAKTLIPALALALLQIPALAQAPTQFAQLVVTDKSKANPKDTSKAAPKKDDKGTDKKGDDGKK